MVDVHQVLLPTDFSPFSDRALHHAIALCKWYQARLTVLYALSSPGAPLTDFPPYLTPVPLTQRERDQLLAHLQNFSRPASEAGIEVSSSLVEGEVVAMILGAAETMPADLVVIGTHGHGGFERLILGSVTEKILRKAPCPVMTIPAPPDRPVPPRDQLFKTILCPVDFSDSSARALRYAASLAREAEGHLTVAHVVEGLPHEDMPVHAHFNVPEYRLYLEADARKRLTAFVAETVQAPAAPELRILSGKAWREILALSRDIDAGLIVMGVQGRGALDIMLFGSTANHLTRAAACPMLTLRA